MQGAYVEMTRDLVKLKLIPCLVVNLDSVIKIRDSIDILLQATILT